MKALCPKILSENSQIKIVYVLLDGVGVLPHPDIENKTPLQAAKTPNMDKLAKNGKMGEVISVGKGIAPESDIAVFNMLGYKFHHADYAGRGVIEAIGTGLDFKDGDTTNFKIDNLRLLCPNCYLSFNGRFDKSKMFCK